MELIAEELSSEVNSPTSILKGKQLVSQQKLASQLPRGTRLDASGTRLEVKGSRNYSPRPLFIGPDEMFEDIVVRGLRADGLSSKLGVKNNRESIAKLISSLFRDDTRHDAIMSHFNSKRQRSNSAKTIFATMTQDELKIMKREVEPVKLDSKIRHQLFGAFDQQRHKFQHSIEVIKQLQAVMCNLRQDNDLLAIHDFQTRGFFSDIFNVVSNLIVKLFEETLTFDPTTDYDSAKETNNFKAKEDASAAEILLSVGTNVQPITNDFGRPRLLKEPITMRPTTKSSPRNEQLNDGKDDKIWTTVEIVDEGGQQKYFIIKTPKDAAGALDTNKLLQLINNQDGILLDNSIGTDASVNPSQELASSQPYVFPTATNNQTTLEIALDSSTSGNSSRKRPNDVDDIITLDAKRFKT